jgi:tetratricopeptide (TPR) repeat protein
MVCSRLAAFTLVLGLVGAMPAAAQPQNARARARPAYDQGLEHMSKEAFEDAVRSFESAVDIDPTFDMALYMLGRAHMSLKHYGSAVRALSECRDLHLAEASRSFEDRQEGNRLRRERVREINRFISELEQVTPQTDRIQEQIRQFQERKRQIEDLDRDAALQPDQAVPAYVSLSLGSAYFRAGDLAEAEKAYLATIAADSKIGEAHSNLAVVYMETGRYDEAERSVQAAEKTGLKVPQALKDEIRKRKGKNP